MPTKEAQPAMTTAATDTQLMTQPETAEYLRVAEHTLENWRYRRIGPRFMKAGGRVVYRRCEVDAWLESRAHGGEAQ